VIEDGADQDDLAARLRRAEASLSEANHRAGNLVQSILSLLRLHQRAAANDEARQLIAAVAARVEALGLVQVAQEHDGGRVALGPALTRLAAGLVELHDPGSVSVTVAGDGVTLPAERVNALGLALAELVGRCAASGGALALVVESRAEGPMLRVAAPSAALAGFSVTNDPGDQLARAYLRQARATLTPAPDGIDILLES
jgi:hypothetical protein